MNKQVVLDVLEHCKLVIEWGISAVESGWTEPPETPGETPEEPKHGTIHLAGNINIRSEPSIEQGTITGKYLLRGNNYSYYDQVEKSGKTWLKVDGGWVVKSQWVEYV